MLQAFMSLLFCSILFLVKWNLVQILLSMMIFANFLTLFFLEIQQKEKDEIVPKIISTTFNSLESQNFEMFTTNISRGI